MAIGQRENFYWEDVTYLNVLDTRTASVLGAHGQLHAIRKDLYPFPPAGTINDDYIIPTSVISRVYRSVYEPTAIVYEEALEMTGFGRHERSMAGNLQQQRDL